MRIIMLGIALTLVCAAYALPARFGYTGQTVIPTAMVAPAGQVQIAADWVDENVNALYPFRVLVGIGANCEVGAAYLAENTDNAWGLNAKWVTPLTLGEMPWALGAVYIKFDDRDESLAQLYFVGTKTLVEAGEVSPAFHGTIGLNWTELKDGFDESEVRGFIGLEAAFPSKLRISADYQTKASSIDYNGRSLWAAKVSYAMTKALTLEAGVNNGLYYGRRDDKKFAGIAYVFNSGQ